MLARIDAAAAVVHSTDRTDDRTLADVQSFDDAVDAVRSAVAALGE